MTRSQRPLTLLPVLHVLFAVFIVQGPAFSTNAEEVIVDDVPHYDASGPTTGEILSALYDSTNGDNWDNRGNWWSDPIIVDNPDGTVTTTTVGYCDFDGITCFDETTALYDTKKIGHVQYINLSNNHLVGTIPDSVFDLPYLEALAIKDNTNLDMSFRNIGNARNLYSLDISNTQIRSLQGLEEARMMRNLFMSNLKLGGEFPESLYQLTRLEALVANSNDFGGTLSNELLSNWKSMRELYLFENDIQGAIPESIGNLTSLEVLSLAQNAFSGSIPTQIEQCTSLREISIQRMPGLEKGQGLSGNLPALTHMPDLSSVHLQYQRLSGNIPPNFLYKSSDSDILRIDLMGNSLTGAVPSTLAPKERMFLYLAGNEITSMDFCDDIPGWMGGSVATTGCDAFMCPPGSFAAQGRAVGGDTCVTCQSARYWGSTTCGGSSSAVSGSDDFDTPQADERSILINLFNQAGGQYWKNNDNWLEPSISVCNWYGITCGSDSKVSSILLHNNGLTGSVPTSIYELSSLQRLDLSGNSIELSFAGISQATELLTLNVAQTDMSELTGFDEVSSLQNLQILNLASNSLSGSIPAVIYALSMLEELDISHNKFSGLIESSIGNLGQLTRFYAFGNRLTGQLPSDISKLVRLREIRAADNAFGGTLPEEYDQLTQLEILSLHQAFSSSDSIFGQLPAYANMAQLTTLVLDGNKLNGQLPSDFLANTRRGSDTVEISLMDNQFEGSIPTSWANRFDNLILELSGNKLTSAIDPSLCGTAQASWMDGQVGSFQCQAILCPIGTYNELGRMSSSEAQCRPCGSASVLGARDCVASGDVNPGDIDYLKALYKSTHGEAWTNNDNWTTSEDYCTWYGITCNVAGDVVAIDLSNNNLTGSPSSDVFKIVSLQSLILKQNALTLSFDGIGEATNLSTLDVSDTNTNSFEGIESAVTLQILFATDNNIEGDIPQELFSLSTLRALDLSFNALSGPLTLMEGAWSTLEDLRLSYNHLTGQLPAAIGQLSSVRTLVLSENNFKGTIPVEMNNLINLEALAIQREGGTVTTGKNDTGIDQGDSQDEGAGLSGPLPSFDRLSKINKLYLGVNSFSGSIPLNFLGGVVDKEAEIEVDLSSNRLTGTIPSSLVAFDSLTLYVADNQITGIADALCLQKKWMSGYVGIFTCDAILCPPGSYNAAGRQTDIDAGCRLCPSGSNSTYFGSYECITEAEQSSVTERMILEEFFVLANGNEWRRQDNWFDSDVSICSWYGITCTSSEEESVQSIIMPQNGLTGEIAGSIYMLPNLQEINLASNEVDIAFEGIENASQLRYLDLDYTGLKSLSGLDAAPALAFLHISGNNFVRQFPAEVTSLASLQVAYLSNNDFGTEFPSLASLNKLVIFSCSTCGFEQDFSLVTDLPATLEYLDLSKNSFYGQFSTGVLQLTNLKHLDVSEQFSMFTDGLTGAVPSFGGFNVLSELYLQHNSFQGSLPSDFLNAVDTSNKVIVDLRSNNITGSVPSSLSQFSDMNMFLSDNLIDSIPESLCSLAWNDVGVPNGSCDHILCGPGTFNGIGRATAALPCESCTDSAATTTTFGSITCGESYEAEILLELYTATQGREWIKKDGWLTDSHFCRWHGISCTTISGVQQITEIDLRNNNLVGIIPDRIWLLTYMTKLKLEGNRIDVAFDRAGDAVSLEELDLSNAQVTSIDGVSAIPILSSLNVANNLLSGPIPEEIFLMQTLRQLYLNYNDFTGRLPNELGNLYLLEELYVFGNSLTGPLPESFANLFSIKVLSLGENQFTGTIPEVVSYLPQLEILNLQREPHVFAPDTIFATITHGLTGDLPSFDKNSRLKELYLGNNFLYGSLPDTFLQGVADKESLIIVDLFSNNIQGAIPTTLTEFGNLRIILSDNAINSIPTEICGMSAWMGGQVGSSCDALLCPPGTYNDIGRLSPSSECLPCDYRGSALYYGATKCEALFPEFMSSREILEELYNSTNGSGWDDKTNWLTESTVCDWFGVTCENDEVAEVWLPSNNLKGQVSGYVFHLPYLRKLNLGNNDVSISLRDVEASTNLKELHIDSTKIRSLAGIGGAKSLESLIASDNNFSGHSIPDELYSLPVISVIDIHSSGLVGSISSNIGRLATLTTFIASNNDLTGVIPDSVGDLQSLENLNLSGNLFYGTLPSGISNLASLRSLLLDSRKRNNIGIAGPLASFSGCANLQHIDLSYNSLTGPIPDDFLSGVTSVADRLIVSLESNFLTGTLPASLGKFARLDIDITDNKLDGLGFGLCDNDMWLNGNVGTYRCNAIACESGKYNAHGRQISQDTQCDPCPGSTDNFIGQTTCPAVVKGESREILESLYTATNGDSWHKSTNWMSDKDICDWYGITCSSSGAVESIILGSNNLIGSPPKEIFNIFGLRLLWLYSNPIDFSFEGIENAEWLTSLQLDSTGLTSLEGVGNAPALVDLDVRFNSIGGRLTTEIASLTSLQTFLCGDNQFEGPLPSFATNRKLVTLRANNNRFFGALPAFNVHPDIRNIDVSNNQLQGELPEDILANAEPSSAMLLDISDNQFEGGLPLTLTRFTDLTLYARDNKITELDPDFCEMTSWNGGSVATYGCDAIVCKPDSYSSLGRATADIGACQQCRDTDYFGQTHCGNVGSAAVRAGAFSFALYLACTSLSFGLFALM